MTKRRKRTETSTFGVSKRESHDSSAFYQSRLYEGQVIEEETGPEQAAPDDVVNRIYAADSRDMSSLPDNCVHLMVTSPPYNVGKEYDEDLSLSDFRELLRAVFAETYRVLAPGGRACINIANVGRRPYIPLHSYIIQDMLDIGYLMRGEIIWDKGASAGGSTAWGSWMSPSNPTLRDVHEYILVFNKGPFKREKKGREATITREDFLELTKSVWSFPSESARKVGHPAPFPVELPRRLIELYTFKGDLVLDPFCGSGSTCIAALMTGRRYVGYDIEPEYVELAQRRIAEYLASAEATGADGTELPFSG